jgi:uncharacterized metal-binding protein
MLVVTVSLGRVTGQDREPVDITRPLNLISSLRTRRIDTVVCGGISRATRELLAADDLAVIENVACSVDRVVAAIADGLLRPGYGFDTDPVPGPSGAMSSGETVASGPGRSGTAAVNCLNCLNRVCVRGETCEAARPVPMGSLPADVHRMLEAATDIEAEEERQLCRLAELVYFCFEMRFHRVGIAYCDDLREPARILAGVLGRSFETVPVCCKFGGPPDLASADDATEARGPSAVPPITCSPVAQAALLNRAGTDLNVIVGLCMGADCVFARESDAPVTTLFVKDRSLANNPIGAVYSEYHLRESVASARPRSGSETVRDLPAAHHDLSATSPGREETS